MTSSGLAADDFVSLRYRRPAVTGGNRIRAIPQDMNSNSSGATAGSLERPYYQDMNTASSGATAGSLERLYYQDTNFDSVSGGAMAGSLVEEGVHVRRSRSMPNLSTTSEMRGSISEWDSESCMAFESVDEDRDSLWRLCGQS
jgi:hypothetical protein